MAKRFLKRLMCSAALIAALGSSALAATMNYIGIWSGTKAYAIGNVVVYNNQVYYALAASTNVIPIPTASQWKLVGTNGMDYKGTWTTTTTYQVGSVVNYNSQNYYSLLATNLNKNPETQTTYWVLVGTTGNTIRSGAGAPLSTQGVVGDFWIDTTNRVIYGPKISSGWPLLGTAMIGAQGAKGDAGVSGATGPQGQQGVAGATGTQGATGAAGTAGAPGTTGAAGLGYGSTTSTSSIAIANSVVRVFAVNAVGAYSVGSRVRVKSTATPANYLEGAITAISGTNVSVEADTIGGTGTFAAWTFSLAGNVGLQGATGATGSAGATGATGPQGVAGPQGPQGGAGATGAAGSQGPIGLQGVQGVKGDKGDVGPNPPPTASLTVNCNSGGKIQAAIDAVPAGTQATISITGNCSENIVIPPAKNIIISGNSNSSLLPLDASKPVVTVRGRVALEQLTIANSTGSNQSIIKVRSGWMALTGSSVTGSNNIGFLVSIDGVSYGEINNSNISGGRWAGVSVNGGSDLQISASNDDLAGPDGFKTTLSSPIGCGGGTIGMWALGAGEGEVDVTGGVWAENCNIGIGGGTTNKGVKLINTRFDSWNSRIMLSDVDSVNTTFSFDQSQMIVRGSSFTRSGDSPIVYARTGTTVTFDDRALSNLSGIDAGRLFECNMDSKVYILPGSIDLPIDFLLTDVEAMNLGCVSTNTNF